MTSAECIHAAQPAHIILTQVHSFEGPAPPDPTLPLPEMPSQSAVTAEIYNPHPNLPVPPTRPYPYPYPNPCPCPNSYPNARQVTAEIYRAHLGKGKWINTVYYGYTY